MRGLLPAAALLISGISIGGLLTSFLSDVPEPQLIEVPESPACLATHDLPPDAQCDSTGTCVVYDPIEGEAWGVGEKRPDRAFRYWFGRRDLTDAEVEPLYRDMIAEALGDPLWPEVDGD